VDSRLRGNDNYLEAIGSKSKSKSKSNRFREKKDYFLRNNNLLNQILLEENVFQREKLGV
jgi:hypothetical protein